MIAACGQLLATTIDEAASVWGAADRLAAQALQRGADLLVLPETTYPAYWLESAERYLGDDIERSPAVLDRFSKLAADHEVWLVSGFVEEHEGRLYNSAAVFDRSGTQVGIARKNFLWDCDNRWFTPGGELPVFDTEFGPIGVLICADGRSPEITATLVCRGARFIVQPAALVNAAAGSGQFRNAQADFLVRSRAVEFGVPFITCSKAGSEGSILEYVGQSQMVGAGGDVIACAASEGEQLLVAEVEPSEKARPPAMDDASRGRLLDSTPPFRAPTPGKACPIPVKATSDAVVALLEEAGGRVVQIGAAELASFVSARCHALDGVQVLVADGVEVSEILVRTRATENRVFIILAPDAMHLVVDPAGRIIWRNGHSEQTVTIDLALADDKTFTPDTDLWDQRRVACYNLGSSTVPSSQDQPAEM